MGLYDKTSNIIWVQNFPTAQGYDISTNIIYQDNMSTLSLTKNDYVSSSKCTKHFKQNVFLFTITTILKIWIFNTVLLTKCGLTFD